MTPLVLLHHTELPTPPKVITNIGYMCILLPSFFLPPPPRSSHTPARRTSAASRASASPPTRCPSSVSRPSTDGCAESPWATPRTASAPSSSGTSAVTALRSFSAMWTPTARRWGRRWRRGARRGTPKIHFIYSSVAKYVH